MNRATRSPLARIRLRARITQTEAAERIGMRRPNYSAIENGRCVPRIDTCSRIAEVLEVDLGEIAHAALATKKWRKELEVPPQLERGEAA